MKPHLLLIPYFCILLSAIAGCITVPHAWKGVIFSLEIYIGVIAINSIVLVLKQIIDE